MYFYLNDGNNMGAPIFMIQSLPFNQYLGNNHVENFYENFNYSYKAATQSFAPQQNVKNQVEQNEQKRIFPLNLSYRIKKERKSVKNICGNEQEFYPRKYAQKNRKKVKQDAKRNIMPNIIHQMFCFIQKKSRSYSIVKRYFQRNQILNYTVTQSVQRFYNYHKILKAKINNYINLQALVELDKYQEPTFIIYQKLEQDQFLRINRILYRQFLHIELNNVIMTSLRMKNTSRIYYLEAKRKIYDHLEKKVSGCEPDNQ